MKSNFIFFIFLFSILSQILAEPKAKKTAFLLNINGTFLYNSPKLKQKLGILRYGDEFSMQSNVENESWLAVDSKIGSGFIDANQNDWILFEEPKGKEFIITEEKEINLSQKPLPDSLQGDVLKSFSVLEVLEKESPVQIKSERIWYKVKALNSIGYVFQRDKQYTSEKEAMEASYQKEIFLDGYAFVNDSIYFKEPNGENFSPKGASKKSEFVRVIKTREVDGLKYFYISMQNGSTRYKMEATPKDFDETPFTGWISESNAKFFTISQFSYSTIKNTNFKGDIRILKKIFAENKDIPLNFMSVYLNPISGNQKDYFIVSILKGYQNSSGYGDLEPVSVVVKKDKNDFKVYKGEIWNSGKLQFVDLDKDNIPEIFSTMNELSYSRIAFSAPRFYAYINGAYKEIPLPGNFLDTYRIDENFLYIYEKLNSKLNIKKFKYLNGKFLNIKNK